MQICRQVLFALLVLMSGSMPLFSQGGGELNLYGGWSLFTTESFEIGEPQSPTPVPLTFSFEGGLRSGGRINFLTKDKWGSVSSFDATKAREVPGVRDVVEISSGVAVAADNTSAAFRGAGALDITWGEGDFAMSSRDIFANFERLSLNDGAVARDEGAVGAALGGAARRIDAKYEVPYLAHATMEPMNCTADVRSEGCEVWAPTQNPQGAQGTVARLTGLGSEQVAVHVMHLGCGWGRRSRTDFVADAVETSMKIGARLYK